MMAVRPSREPWHEGVFTTRQAAHLSGLPSHTLAYWAASGFLAPSAPMAQGRGTWRGYTFRDIVRLRVAKHLREAGISLQGLRTVQERLQQAQAPETPWGDTYLVTNGRDVCEVHRDPAAVQSRLQQAGQWPEAYVIVDLAHTVVEVLQALDAVRRRGGKRAEGRGR